MGLDVESSYLEPLAQRERANRRNDTKAPSSRSPQVSLPTGDQVVNTSVCRDMSHSDHASGQDGGQIEAGRYTIWSEEVWSSAGGAIWEDSRNSLT